MTARDYAIKAHGTQMYGDQPYVVHLDAVFSVLQEFGNFNPELLAASYLHDVLEDVPEISEKDLEYLFGPEVVYLVKFCTDIPGKNRRERKAKTYERITKQLSSGFTPELFLNCVKLKLADRLANLRQGTSLLQMYQKESQAFQTALKTLPYQDEALQAMWVEYDRLIGS